MRNPPDDSVFSPENLSILEEQFQRYQTDPSAVSPEWRQFFDTFEQNENNGNGAHSGGVPHIPKLSSTDRGYISDLNLKVLLLLQAYRRHGHFSARTDPLGLNARSHYNLNLEDHGMRESDLDAVVRAHIAGVEKQDTLRNIIQHMEKVYCDSIGAEFFYIRDESRRNWIIEHLENERHLDAPRKAVQRMLFDKLWSAESLEKFIARRYPGKKRFSLEGGESLIPTLASVVENAGSYEIRQIVIGMAHRGRVNVLKNVMGKDIMQIFAEFDENIDAEEVAGDVKYHMGYSSDVAALTGENVHLSLAFNPSHLEVINPVVLGSVRARQTRGNDKERTRYLPVIIHGDAAFAGQGINYECLNMSGLEGYRVGGALHIIVNNQIGFTTLPEEGRSTPYCTDLAKMLQAPIFHVNGDDPEACYRAVQLCLEWRQVFRTDIFLDLICYRRWGHNETDEPAFTQPVMYDRIKKHSSTVTLYEERLKSDNFDQAELDEIKQSRNQELETAFERIKNEQHKIERETLAGQWSGFKRANALSEPDTTISPDRLEHITRHVTTVPDNFPAHRKIERLLQQRVQMVSEDRIDWGMAESLCYGALLLEGVSVRISGQDARRGTFSHRHAAIYNLENQKPYIPLAHLNPSRARFEIMNSLLSEVAVLGFEFGYSLADPRTLVIWEAQFGDFANGAQVIIDQFISSCEAKWNRMSGIVLLLPHGYEGQGPEHSSARLERFLQLCSQNNIQVCNPTTPAQYFHLIRRQMKRDYRKPLIIMSPKSLLRMPMATSATAEFTDGQFQDVLDDPTADPDGTQRVLLCSGKIYYDLLQMKVEQQLNHLAIVRIEQLYPYPVNSIASILQKYSNADEICWVQEEPRNQGAWLYMEDRLFAQIDDHQDLLYIGRLPSPSPATGYFKVHQREQSEILERAVRLRSDSGIRLIRSGQSS